MSIGIPGLPKIDVDGAFALGRRAVEALERLAEATERNGTADRLSRATDRRMKADRVVVATPDGVPTTVVLGRKDQYGRQHVTVTTEPDGTWVGWLEPTDRENTR
jgi:hypothetical protein